MCVLTGSMPVAAAVAADFESLTRRHAIKLIPAVACSVAEAALAVGEVVGCDSVKSASRMNGTIVMFLDNTAKVSEVVETGVVIHDTFNPVLPLVNPATRVMISNAPPFIKNETLAKELSRYGQIVSQIKMVSLGSKSPKLRHVVSHRRQVFMVLRDNTKEINLSFTFKIEGFNYMVFVSSEAMKCFECGEEGHLARSCPGRVERRGRLRQLRQRQLLRLRQRQLRLRRLLLPLTGSFREQHGRGLLLAGLRLQNLPPL